jgi:hypothetical protein
LLPIHGRLEIKRLKIGRLKIRRLKIGRSRWEAVMARWTTWGMEEFG